MKDNELVTKTSQLPDAPVDNVAYGFEKANAEDILIPRLKVINALSPERQEGTASEGDIINSLTGENVAGIRFIPIQQYYSNIEWNPDRGGDPRIICRSFDGRIGHSQTGTLSCATCKRNQFDNTKVGRDAFPQCTAYINFLGFLEDSPMPVVLSFAKTNYNEGKKLLSIARSMRSSIWNYAYTLRSVQVTKDRNKWFNIQVAMVGETTYEERQLAYELYRAYSDAVIKADYEEVATSVAEPNAEIASEI